jgi:hypothetical protein
MIVSLSDGLEGANHTDLPQEDPPFYLARRSSSEDNEIPEISKDVHKRRLYDQAQAIQPPLSRMESSGSNSEDFRSVIDDLTIENQKLWRRIRTYERVYNPHLQKDRLFEVRIHGLLPLEKQRLEETLRDFVSSLDNSSNDRAVLVDQRPVSLRPMQDHDFKKKLSSAYTDNSRPVDSAYASMSTSGNASGSQSHRVELRKPHQVQMSKSQNIRSYLQDIPGVLLPKHSPMITERSRKKLVVRRLEQLFTGKGPSSVEQGQTQQQQEVSQSAARADRNAVEARGQKVESEGLREAKIQQLNAESSNGLAKMARVSSNDEESNGGTNWSSNNATPNQRPTRPLDLDLHRAQVPAENIDYIRHLGVGSPKLDAELAQDREEGWVYLNLLIGMAQLHTLNITPEFVRKAVLEVSEKFEISPDGAKLRWRGGTEGTRMSSDSCSITSPEDDNASSDGAPPTHSTQAVGSSKSGANNRPSFKHGSCSTQSGNAVVESSVSPEPVRPANPLLSYKPLFGARTGSEEMRDPQLGDGNSTMTSPSYEENDHGYSPNPEDGPIIFYNGACFCSDLSGDMRNYPPDVSANFTNEVLGCPHEASSSNKSDQKGIFSNPYVDINTEMIDVSGNDYSPLTGFTTPVESNRLDVYHGPAHFQLPASGVGGVQPRDNFAIDVESRQVVEGPATSKSTPRSTPSPIKHRQRQSFISSYIEKSIRQRKACRPRVKTDILNARRTDLQPASLPPPSYVCFPSSSSCSDDEDSQDEDSDDAVRKEIANDSISEKLSPTALLDVQPFPHPRIRLLRKFSSESTKDTTGYESDDDSSSIDMLAHARKVDPETVTAYEREFDTAIEEGLEPTPGALVNTARVLSNSDEQSEESEPGSEGQIVAVRKRERSVDKSLNRFVKRLRVSNQRREE